MACALPCNGCPTTTLDTLGWRGRATLLRTPTGHHRGCDHYSCTRVVHTGKNSASALVSRVVTRSRVPARRWPPPQAQQPSFAETEFGLKYASPNCSHHAAWTRLAGRGRRLHSALPLAAPEGISIVNGMRRGNMAVPPSARRASPGRPCHLAGLREPARAVITRRNRTGGDT